MSEDDFLDRSSMLAWDDRRTLLRGQSNAATDSLWDDFGGVMREREKVPGWLQQYELIVPSVDVSEQAGTVSVPAVDSNESPFAEAGAPEAGIADEQAEAWLEHVKAADEAAELELKRPTFYEAFGSPPRPTSVAEHVADRKLTSGPSRRPLPTPAASYRSQRSRSPIRSAVTVAKRPLRPAPVVSSARQHVRSALFRIDVREQTAKLVRGIGEHVKQLRKPKKPERRVNRIRHDAYNRYSSSQPPRKRDSILFAQQLRPPVKMSQDLRSFYRKNGVWYAKWDDPWIKQSQKARLGEVKEQAQPKGKEEAEQAFYLNPIPSTSSFHSLSPLEGKSGVSLPLGLGGPLLAERRKQYGPPRLSRVPSFNYSFANSSANSLETTDSAADMRGPSVVLSRVPGAEHLDEVLGFSEMKSRKPVEKRIVPEKADIYDARLDRLDPLPNSDTQALIGASISTPQPPAIVRQNPSTVKLEIGRPIEPASVTANPMKREPVPSPVVHMDAEARPHLRRYKTDSKFVKPPRPGMVRGKTDVMTSTAARASGVKMSIVYPL
ncbi:hypothetical protein H2203_008490 [Taxawa tesnikishii (nom. ined.)]|nr:hypothetical protein H2203_008490 [Dothideales sp. JES 119]